MGRTGTIRGGADADMIALDPRARAFGPLVAGDGDDTVYAQNGVVDDVRCGPGTDDVSIDLEDVMSDCEVVFHRIDGTGGDDDLVGSRWNDIISAYTGADTLTGGAGDDSLGPDEGADTVRGGSGHDQVWAPADGVVDVVQCGTGTDTVTAGPEDSVGGSCENVTRKG